MLKRRLSSSSDESVKRLCICESSSHNVSELIDKLDDELPNFKESFGHYLENLVGCVRLTNEFNAHLQDQANELKKQDDIIKKLEEDKNRLEAIIADLESSLESKCSKHFETVEDLEVKIQS